jgi:5-methylcytosine-specific restriction enzyme subunit McrC
MAFRVTLSEHGHVERDLQPVLQAAGVGNEELERALRPLVQLTPTWSGKIRFRADRTIGTLQVGQLRVDVHPRMAADDLVTMIRYALGGQPEATQQSTIGPWRVGLDELICSIFAAELTRVHQAGLSRQYVNRQQRLEVLRGRPDFVSSFPWNDRGMTSLTCRYHELTCDDLNNQLIRAALERAMLFETRVRTRRQLLEHRHVWSAVASMIEPVAADFGLVRSRYNRLNEHYRLAHHLIELVLRGHRPGHIFESSPVLTGGLSLDMAELFELFVTRLLSEQLSPHGLTVVAQRGDGGAFIDGQGEVYTRIRPDLIVYRRGVPVALVDAKYKPYWEATQEGRPVRRIGTEDLYQVFFYAQRLQMRHGLVCPPLAFIVSPHPGDAEAKQQSQVSERYRRVSWRAGSDPGAAVALVLLPLTRVVQRLAADPGGVATEVTELLEPVLRACNRPITSQ